MLLNWYSIAKKHEIVVFINKVDLICFVIHKTLTPNYGNLRGMINFYILCTGYTLSTKKGRKSDKVPLNAKKFHNPLLTYGPETTRGESQYCNAIIMNNNECCDQLSVIKSKSIIVCELKHVIPMIKIF